MADQHSPDQLAAILARTLDVTPVEENFFLGQPMPEAKGRTFGGLVLSQALMAAAGTVAPERPAHSLHGYFMRPGNATAPVLYQVERDRDGQSFTTRRVVAIQSGKPILNLACSFHAPEEGEAHADEMPDVPPPEELISDEEMAERMADELPAELMEWMRRPKPVELRHASGGRAPFVRGKQAPMQAMWFRVRGALGDDMRLHRAAMVYASDFGLLGTALLPHDRTFWDGDTMTASLDHAVWIHTDLRADDWLLYVMDSPWAGGARGFNRGRIFTRDGRLVANTAQEGLIRPIGR